MERSEIIAAIYDAVAEAYEIEANTLDETSVCANLPNHSSSKVLKVALFIGENLDQDEDLTFKDVADCANLGEVADMCKAKYGL